MTRPRRGLVGLSAALGSMFVLIAPCVAVAAPGLGVGGATWTPGTEETSARPSTFLMPADSIVVSTRASWPRAQVDGLARYAAEGLRYTLEVNDRSGRLSATGFWATDLPDPAFDRDDDDGDQRWEEAEMTSATELPRPGREYTTVIEFSRWRPVQRPHRCDWAWDLRAGQGEVLSQLSLDLLGEWQAERYTLAYDRVTYPRVGPRPALPAGTPGPDCGPAGVEPPGSESLVVTFVEPIAWQDFLDLGGDEAPWSAFEAVGAALDDGARWTCGGPVAVGDGLDACRRLGVQPDGVVAAGGYPSPAVAARIRADTRVIDVRGWRDPLPTWVGQMAGLDVQPPDLTLDDRYWPLVLEG